jgi:hypothetical protein
MNNELKLKHNDKLIKMIEIKVYSLTFSMVSSA